MKKRYYISSYETQTDSKVRRNIWQMQINKKLIAVTNLSNKVFQTSFILVTLRLKCSLKSMYILLKNVWNNFCVHVNVYDIIIN